MPHHHHTEWTRKGDEIVLTTPDEKGEGGCQITMTTEDAVRMCCRGLYVAGYDGRIFEREEE